MKNKDWWFGFGAILILIGVLLHIIGFWLAPYIYSVGAIFVFALRLMSPLKSDDFRVKRLMRIQFVSSALLIVSAYFMFTKENTWALTLFLAAIFDLYIIYRLPKKEK